MALLFLASPIVFAPSALHEEQTGLWVRAGLPRSVVKKLALPGGTESFHYALVAGEGIYRASSGAASTPAGTGPQPNDSVWQPVDSDLPSRRWRSIEVQALAADSGNPSVLYAGMGGAGSRDPAQSAGLYVSNDGGQSWQYPVRSIAGQEVQAIAVMPRPSRVGEQGGAEAGTSRIAADQATQTAAPDGMACAATSSSIYCSTGASQSWIRVDWRGTERVLSLAIRPGDPRVIYVGTAGFGLAITEDGGSTWKQRGTELQNRLVYDIAISLSSPELMYVATDSGLFGSADAGSTWTEMPGPTKGRQVNTIVLHPEGVTSGEAGTLAARPGENEIILYAGLQHGAAYRSVDGGRSWEALKKGLGSLTVLSLAVDPQSPSILWAGTTDGVWRYMLPVVSPAAGPSPFPRGTPVATVPSLPQDTVLTPHRTEEGVLQSTLTRTALPSVTPTTTATPTQTTTPTATGTLAPTATPTLQASPTYTATPSPTPTETATPLPPPAPPPSSATATKVPR